MFVAILAQSTFPRLVMRAAPMGLGRPPLGVESVRCYLRAHECGGGLQHATFGNRACIGTTLAGVRTDSERRRKGKEHVGTVSAVGLLLIRQTIDPNPLDS